MNDSVLNSHSLAVVLMTLFVVFACVMLHYETFTLLTRALGRLHVRVRRRRILLLMFGLITLHIVEIWIFAGAYFLLVTGQEISHINGTAGGLLDLVYYSAVVYTTLGLGDLVPSGAIRFLTGMEALTGFLLITWSASFTFIEMQRFWRND